MDNEKIGQESLLTEPLPVVEKQGAAAKKGGMARPLLFLLLVVAALGIGFFLFGQNLFSTTSVVISVESSVPSKIKVPERPKPIDKTEAAKEAVASSDELAALAPPPTPVPARETKSGPTPALASTPVFALISSSYLYTSTLNRALSQIEKMGYRVSSSQKSEAHEMTRLRVGLYEKPLAMKRLAEVNKISGEGFLVAEEGKYAVYAGSYLSLDNARRLAGLLYQEGVRVEEVRVKVDLPRTTLRFGGFATRAEAQKAVDDLGKVEIDKLQIVPFE